MMEILIEENELNEGELPVNKIVHGHVLEVLKKFPDESVDCVITSPPYWGKRDYGEETVVEWSDGAVCQLGLEPTSELYVEHLIEIFGEVKRVLKPHGNVFVVIDDTYSGSGKGHGWLDPKYPNARNGQLNPKQFENTAPRKSLCLVPELFATSMVYELGFILRNKIIWTKKVHIYKDRTTIGNAMPESVKDRLAHTYEYVFHFVKEPKYWYDLCLSGDTEIYIKENGLIKPVTLRMLYKMCTNHPKSIEILTPFGWKPLRGIVGTFPQKIYRVQAGHITEIYASHNHRFPVSQRNNAMMFKRVEEISNRHDRDYLLFVPLSKYITPKITQIDLSKLGLKTKDGYIYAERVRSYKIPKILNLDYDLGYFLGAWLAEGNIENKWKIRFSLRKGEYLLHFLKTYLKRFNIHLTISEFREKNAVQAVFSNPVFVRIIRFFCLGNNSHDKGLNMDIILNTPANFRKGILDGFMEGDGTENKDALYTSIASKRLRDDLALLCSSLGYEFSKYDETINGKIYYGLRVFPRGKYKKRNRRFHKINKISHNRGSNQRTCKYIPAFEAYFVGSKVEEVEINTDFYDLEVEGELFIINGGIITHNSAVRVPHKANAGWLKTSVKPIDRKTQTINKSPDSREPITGSIVAGFHPLGANPGDVLQINTEPFPEAHFAVFPTRLVEFLIKVGCPEQVCKRCGKPRERIVEKNYIPTRPGKNVLTGKSGSDLDPNKALHTSELSTKRMMIEYYTVGWTDCGCGASFEPGIVLDPFLGSGTTALVALKMGRRFVGVEINRDYCEIALRRIEPHLSQLNLTNCSEK